MKKKYGLRRLFLMAFAMAFYATKINSSYFSAPRHSQPDNKSSAHSQMATETKVVVKNVKNKLKKTVIKIDPIDSFDPTAPLAYLYNDKSAISNRPSSLWLNGIRVDLIEIDLLVENEIVAGTIRTKKDIDNFRQLLIHRRVGDDRAPSSLRK